MLHYSCINTITISLPLRCIYYFIRRKSWRCGRWKQKLEEKLMLARGEENGMPFFWSCMFPECRECPNVDAAENISEACTFYYSTLFLFLFFGVGRGSAQFAFFLYGTEEILVGVRPGHFWRLFHFPQLNIQRKRWTTPSKHFSTPIDELNEYVPDSSLLLEHLMQKTQKPRGKIWCSMPDLFLLPLACENNYLEGAAGLWISWKGDSLADSYSRAHARMRVSVYVYVKKMKLGFGGAAYFFFVIFGLLGIANSKNRYRKWHGPKRQ